jgi:hypothetical protein
MVIDTAWGLPRPTAENEGKVQIEGGTSEGRAVLLK